MLTILIYAIFPNYLCPLFFIGSIAPYLCCSLHG